MKHTKLSSYGIIFAIIGVVLFSAKAVLVKLAYKYDISSEHLLLFRMLFSLPFYIGVVLIKQRKNSQEARKKDYLWILFFGIIGYYLASYFDFLGLQYIKAGLERIILFLYPTLVIIISKVFLNKRISNRQLQAILITYIGVLITFWGELQLENTGNLYLGAILVFMSALTYAIYIVGSGWLIPKFGVIVFTSYAMIVSSLCIILQYVIFDRTDILSYPLELYLICIAMAIFSTIIPSYLVSAAIAKLGASNFSIIASLGPFSTIILAYFFLGENLSLIQIVGTLVVILGIYIVTKRTE
ncbi:DMT family transporter [Aquimarina sp. AD10]|uniref:Permease n=1 Tax=Aquimarina aggregata TaxID=1642818 RepID=A0A162CTX6_9FLAO|nr:MULTISPECIES: DMT family transporter [Aquimarina]AXT59878.1 DMT family transporter [Aquimarina sp. AD10]KZS42134.1 permease [Aquimarina aggregata]RKN00205.1 DMT family transporter [Aquimarina sp. AD10]